MRLLQSHGALEQYMLLQNMLSKLDADIELLSKNLDETANLEEKGFKNRSPFTSKKHEN
jgi:hypothetical protein